MKLGFSGKSFNTSFIIGLVFMSTGMGFSLMGWTGLGMAFFFFLPLAIGISSGILPEPKQAALGVIVSLAIFGVVLLFTGAEGLVCIIMALPILLLAILIGWVIGQAIRKKRATKDANLQLSLSPLLIFFVANFFELFSGSSFVPAEISDEITLEASPSEVYQKIIHVDTVDASPSMWHYLGLPMPLNCILSKEKIGGLRSCSFDQGKIVETIREIKKNELLVMDVTEVDLGNRSWLKFDQDIYEITAVNEHQTKIKRTTTYASTLRPRKYWEIMEAITIGVQQDLVFRNLAKDVEQD